MTDLLGGSHYSLGLLFEAILNCQKNKNKHRGKVCEMIVKDDITKLLENCIHYIERRDNKHVDAVVITNLQQQKSQLKVFGLDFSENAA